MAFNPYTQHASHICTLQQKGLRVAWVDQRGVRHQVTGCAMQDRRDIAHGAGKPIVLEEYGCCKAADYSGKRGEVLRAFHKAADDLGYAGLMTWGVRPAILPASCVVLWLFVWRLVWHLACLPGLLE
jgi:endo-1,4-beta-mannosidase